MKPLYIYAALVIVSASVASAETTLHGTGSTLAGSLYSKWAAEYRRTQKDVKVEYEWKDSSEAVDKALHNGSDFAVADTPFTLEEERLAQSRTVLHLPVALQAVAITYNLPGIPTGLQISPMVLSGIFLGNIKKWNDPDLKALNPGLDLPDLEIRVVHREDESALHDLFPAFLAKLDPKWTLKREKERDLHWPVGQNERGNDKVLERLRLWPGVIAAVDLTFAVQKNLPVAALKNGAGEFVMPNANSLTAALSGFQNLPEDFEVNLTQSHSKGAYPLCAFSYLLVHQNYFDLTHDRKKTQALVDFLNWVLGEGQKLEGDLSYAPLPEGFLPQVREKVQTIKP